MTITEARSTRFEGGSGWGDKKLSAEKPMWVDGSGMGIDAVRAFAWEWLQRNEHPAPVEDD